jgi:hypothetical protein
MVWKAFKAGFSLALVSPAKKSFFSFFGSRFPWEVLSFPFVNYLSEIAVS